jgi:hypothetical protein
MEAAAVPLWSSRRTRELAAFAGLGGLAACSAAIVAAAENGVHVLVPSATKAYPGWLRGPLSAFGLAIDSSGVAWLVVAMCACYVLVLVCADAVTARTGIAVVVGLHVLFMLAPPLLSSDVFGYIDLARLGTLHGIDPYSSGSTPVPPDPVHLYRRWHSDLPSPYSPVFTLVSYALVPLGVAGDLWSYKVMAAVGSLAAVWLVWRCAAALGRDPLKAALFVGLNPVLLLFGVAGDHNDFLAIVPALAAIYLVIAGRERISGGLLVLAAAFKIPLALPFLFAAARPGARRRALVTGAAITLAAFAVVSIAVFGSHADGFVNAIREQQNQVAVYSVPNQVGVALGLGGITAGIRLVAEAALIATLLLALRAAWRGADWVAAAGWTMFALLVTTAWLLPWYVTWLLPLAAISGDRRLRLASLALVAYVVITRVTIWAALPT